MSSRAARSGLHVCLSSLLLISAILPTMIPSAVLAESPEGIIIEDADWVGIDPLEPSPPMPDVSPRVVVEYGGFIRRGGLEGTSELPDITPRTIVEYSSSILHSRLEGTTALPDTLPRVIVEYGGSIVRNDLQGTTAMPHTSPRIIVTSASSIVHASLTPMSDPDTQQIELSLKAGWNLVSVPVIPADTSVAAVFAGAEVVYAWNAATKKYYTPTQVEDWRGYWVAVMSDTVITIRGVPVYNWSADTTAGWNLIGSVYQAVDFSAPDTEPPGKVEAFCYRWVPGTGYSHGTALEPGEGHWIAATGDCVLTISAQEN